MKKSFARIDARSKGLRFYTPEIPCKKGHSLRTVSGGACIECRKNTENARVALDREKYNARKKQERANKLPELAKKAQESRKVESLDARVSRLEKAKIKQREWRLKNPNHAGSKLAKMAYKKANPGKVLAHTAKRRAAKMQRTPAWLTDDDFWMMEQAYELAVLRTKMFGFSWHVDHIIPMQGKYISGLHVPYNLQVIPGAENISKANKYLPA